MRAPASTSVFQVSDKAVLALWDDLARELETAMPGGTLSEGALEAARHYFFGVLLSFPQHVLTGVSDATNGATPTLRIAVSDRFKRHFIGTAKDLRMCISH